jgi:hypothetical protein
MTVFGLIAECTFDFEAKNLLIKKISENSQDEEQIV